MKGTYLMDFLRRISAKSAGSRWPKAAIVLSCAFLVTFLVARMVFFSNVVVGDNALIVVGNDALTTLKSGPILQEYTLQAWNRGAYGQTYPSPSAYLILYLFNQIAAFAGTFQVFNLMMNLSFPLSFISFYFFSGKFCKGFWLRVFGSAFYIVNPIVITYYNFGGFMWALVFLPLSLSSFINLLEKHSNRNLVKAAVFTSLTMWAFPSLSVALILILATIALTYFMWAQPKKVFLKVILPRLAVFFLSIIALNASYLYAQFGYYQSPSFGYEGASALRDFEYTYQSMSVPNLLRFSGNIASPQVSLGYLDPTIIANEIGLIIPIIAFASIFWVRRYQENKRVITAMLASIAFVSFFTVIIRVAVNSQLSWIITSIPELWTLRNPIKLQIMLVVCMIPLFIFSLEKIMASSFGFLRGKNYRLVLVTFALVFLGISQIYIYNASAFNGYNGMDITYPDTQVLSPNPTLLIIINDSAEWYTDGTYRGMILPFDHNAELHVQFTNPLLYTSRLDQNSQLANELGDIANLGSNFSPFLSLLSTKYLYINNNWTDTGFPIIQPKNMTKLTESLNLTEESFGDYSKFVVDEALPRLYLSNDQVFFSNIETMGLLNSSIFRPKPVFIQIKDTAAKEQTEISGLPSINMVSSYEFELPLDNSYDIYAVTYGSGEGTPIYYAIDQGAAANVTLLGNGTALNKLAQTELKSGVHTISAFTSNTTAFEDLSPDFLGTGSWNISNGTIRIDNGTLITSGEYDNFDFQLEFKPVLYGQDSWNGPEIFLNLEETSPAEVSSCFRLIFHNDGLVELAQLTPNGYEPGILTRKCNLNSGDTWNRLRITKNTDTFFVYLNGEYLLSYTDDSIAKTGKLAIGSDSSTTVFRDVTVSKDVIAGFWLLPAESRKETPFTYLEMNPDKYRLEFNQTGDSPILLLGENYDAGWEAFLDGKPLSRHFEANLYANSWLMNTTSGTHQIEISYKHNATYQIIINLNIAAMGALINIAYFPTKIRIKNRFWRKSEKANGTPG